MKEGVDLSLGNRLFVIPAKRSANRNPGRFDGSDPHFNAKTVWILFRGNDAAGGNLVPSISGAYRKFSIIIRSDSAWSI